MTDSHLYKKNKKNKKIISVISIFLSGYSLRIFEKIFDLTSIMNFFESLKQYYYGSKIKSFKIQARPICKQSLYLIIGN